MYYNMGDNQGLARSIIHTIWVFTYSIHTMSISLYYTHYNIHGNKQISMATDYIITINLTNPPASVSRFINKINVKITRFYSNASDMNFKYFQPFLPVFLDFFVLSVPCFWSSSPWLTSRTEELKGIIEV